ncbi:FHA domain-containing protein [Pseudoxanthomonas gei]|uniref:FHA domain-containing protein n=1 Tax=Pseudoxanthomonas gei TaxID=1383030 RepID=UPI001B86B3FC|nr:FHA domain-containing protein [Pseudoxanthomonas gei]
MLVSRRVENLRLHFGNRQQPDRVLVTGVHRVVREASGLLGVGDGAQGALLAQFCMDRRGLWLQVPTGSRGIHVNGRPVQRMAMLRAGDTVYLDGAEILVQASHHGVDVLPKGEPGDATDPRIVLRGVGGKYHGRSFTLLEPCLVGRSAASAIRIDDPVFAERHAQLERRGDRVLLRDLGSATGSMVNGTAVRDALLAAGDQVAFDSQHRFVLEVPWQEAAGDAREFTEDRIADGRGESEPAKGRHSIRRWPWLLLAALFLGATLSALLLFGAR